MKRAALRRSMHAATHACVSSSEPPLLEGHGGVAAFPVLASLDAAWSVQSHKCHASFVAGRFRLELLLLLRS
jgi:hypothetical protein